MLFLNIYSVNIGVILVVIIYVILPLLILSLSFVQLNLGLQRDLVRELNIWWPDLKAGTNMLFWRHEYNYHGSCFFERPVWYFDSAFQKLWRIPNLSGLTNAGCILLIYVYRGFRSNFLYYLTLKIVINMDFSIIF